MIIIAKILCDCGEDITVNAVTLGGYIFCLTCAEGVARNILTASVRADDKLRQEAIEVLALCAAGMTPKEKRS